MSADHHHSSHPVTGRYPHFAPRQHLAAHQLNEIVDEELRRHRLLNIALHGFGLVSGYQLAVDEKGQLKVDAKHGVADISCGLILDRHGRDLWWSGGPLRMRAIVGKMPDREGEYLLLAHYAEQRVPGDGCWHCRDRTQWVEQSVVFTLAYGCVDHPGGCPEVKPCTTLDDFVCARTGNAPGKVDPAPDLPWICEKPGELCASECGEWRYDPDAGVPIACVSVGKITPDDAKCDRAWGFLPMPPSACSVRPFVYRTPLLYELIRGCHIDLARVQSHSWEDLLKQTEVPWDAFKVYFDRPFERLWVRFTKPIQVATIHEGSVFLSAVSEDADYRLARRIPLRVEPLEPANGFAAGARLVPIPNRRGVYDWVEDEIWGDDSELSRGCRIELTVRGHLLRDECGRTLNAIPIDVNPIGAPPRWSGLDQPGDDFIASFRVAPRGEQRAPNSNNAELAKGGTQS